MVTRIQHGNIRGFLEKNTEAVFKFYHDSAAENNIISSPCIVLKSQEPENEKNITETLKTFSVSSSQIHIYLETWEDDKGEIFNHDKGDDAYSLTAIDIELDSLAPGVFSTPFTYQSKDNKFTIGIKVRYGMPVPEPIAPDATENILNAAKSVTLKSHLSLGNKQGLKYDWEFRTAADTGWKSFGQTLSESVVFFPERDLIKSAIKKNLELYFRFRSKSAEITGPYSEPISIEVTPSAPIIERESVKIFPTCPNRASGKIEIGKIKTSADSASWFVVKGKLIAPDETVENLLAQKVGTEILEEGDYTVITYNAGMNTGKVLSTYAFSVEKYPELIIRKSEKKDATCPKSSDGEIRIETEGGSPGKLTFLISPSAGKPETNERSATFKNLLPGVYSVVVIDECEQLISADNIEVKSQNESLQGSINSITPPTDNQQNGSIHISIEGGSGSYQYVLFKDGATPITKGAGNLITIDKVQKGDYKLTITDSKLSGCSVWDTSFSIQATITEIKTDTISQEKDKEIKIEYVDKQHLFYGVGEKTAVVNAAYKTGAVAGDYFIVIEKSAYTLKVYNSKKELIATYPVVFGNDDQTDKMFEGDKRTPEGLFTIVEKRDHDKWDKFLLLDYPNAESYRRFIDRKAKKIIPQSATIGHSVGLHGTWANDNITVDMKKNWTDGCISTKNNYIEDLYTYMPVGTKVLIKK